MTVSSEAIEQEYYLVSREARKHRGWFLFLGIVMVLTGLGALLFPFIATLASTLALGAILLVAGLFGVIHAFRVRPWKGFWSGLLTSLLTLVIGGLLLGFPMEGMITVTVLITTLFLVSGVFRTILAFQLKPYDSWGWILASGILALVLGILVITMLPEAALWLIGLLVGIDFLFAGWSLLALTIMNRKQTATP